MIKLVSPVSNELGVEGANQVSVKHKTWLAFWFKNWFKNVVLELRPLAFMSLNFNEEEENKLEGKLDILEKLLLVKFGEKLKLNVSLQVEVESKLHGGCCCDTICTGEGGNNVQGIVDGFRLAAIELFFTNLIGVNAIF